MNSEYDLLVVNTGEVNFSPENVHTEILQNVITICSTLKGSVPMDREFGINTVITDEPLNRAKARISAEITEAIRKYEPRARVTQISFENETETGTLRPRIKLRILI